MKFYMIASLFIVLILNTISSFSNPIENSDISIKEFCLYTKSGMIKVTNPFYINKSNETIYFENIEEYAKYIGPTWFGVANCGNNTLVNYIGEYYKISENPEKANKKREEANKKNNEENYNNIGSNEDENVYKILTLDEYRNEYKRIYEKLMKNGLKSISLTSENPAYNPYHPSLIRVKNVKNPNFIKLQYYIPYNLKESKKFMELIEGETNKFKECGMIKGAPGSSLICSVSVSSNIEDTVSITNTNGESFHKAYGKVYSEGDTVTSEINNSIDLAYSLSNSKSISTSKSEGNSNALEHVYTVVKSTSKSETDNTEYTHTNNHEDSYSYTENEEHSHTRTDGGEHIEEQNWSDSTEKSHTEEYSRMEASDYKKAQKSDIVKRGGGATVVKTSGGKSGGNKAARFADAVTGAATGAAAGCAIGTLFGPGIGTAIGCGLGLLAGGISSVIQTGAEVEANVIAREANTYAKQSANAADLANTYANEANKIANRSIDSQENIAQLDRALQESLAERNENFQIKMALAGTRSTSDTTTTIHQTGGSITDSVNWSDAYTTTSGFSNSWGETNGYSDAHTVGHSETSTEENSKSDSVSMMLTTNYNKETGWVSEESKSKTATTGYSYGKSNQKSFTNNLSYDTALDKSAEFALNRAQSLSKGETFTRQLTFVVPDDKCYSLTAFPLYNVEINIWINGYYDAYGKLGFEFNKSIHPVEFLDFVINPVECGMEDEFVDLVKNDVSNFVFTKEDDNIKTKLNTLLSDTYLREGSSITTKSGKYSFGVLKSGELVLCVGSSISKNCKRLWTNKMDYIPTEINGKEKFYDFRLHVGTNGHLYVTAKNIFKKHANDTVEYPEEYYQIVKDYIDSNNDTEHNSNKYYQMLKKYINKYFDDKNNEVDSNNKKRNYEDDDNDDEAYEEVDDCEEFDNCEEYEEYPIEFDDHEEVEDTTSSFSISSSTTTNKLTTTSSTIIPISSTTSSTTTNKLTTTSSTIIPISSTTSSTTTTKSSTTSSTTTTKSFITSSTTTTKSTSTTNNPLPTMDDFDNNDYIIWDSLPKDLPFNVGYPDKTGYYLYIKDEPGLDGASVSLIDGAGVTIWQIKAGENDYVGYHFPAEYNLPLDFDTKKAEGKISLYDKHNVLEPSVIDTYTHSIEMNCSNEININEALVSTNGKYRFYIQSTGNMVVKENFRTQWSSLTANIDIFESPYKVVFSPLGELILRDKNMFSVWQTLNPLSIDNNDDIVNTHKFYLVLIG
ncbi:hypothetical protein LY90DRAFT_643553 [Neocallimastix californiae]|uniref:Bulb-type lectin domain-containing protein n=1 Tax=Neocallimastix californiae TaxID=1754190 RepID=A0A1Y1YE28_9FUNG|nr:hypothetical protein LY90DRAFT_643553 [Neocallimastix californiae]|eukprot:ORX96173.1 hypothetical protein LY90DRAFT_643553 [Neocallimastix californiae]